VISVIPVLERLQTLVVKFLLTWMEMAPIT